MSKSDENREASGLASGSGRHKAVGGRHEAVGDGELFAADLAELEVHFESALREMMMFFQPIVHADQKRIFGYEALLRSKEPALPHPGAIIEAAERLNRLQKLGRTIRGSVAQTFGATDDSLGTVFVNLHALDLMDNMLSSRYAPLAKLAHRVVLEVTERASLDGIPDVRNRVADLRQMGYRIAIDDLGAGHARMKEFSPLDTDFVKLDISVVRDIDTRPMKQQFVASIIELCAEQNIKVIGEGVETAEEVRVLVDLGCDLLQGFYLARPGPPFPSLI